MPWRVQTCHDAISGHRPLELGKHPEHAEQCPARGRRGFDALLVEEEIDVAGS
jgi:hypothetical protein